MSFIYPECPSCGKKSEDGVELQRMPEFEYNCPNCDTTRWGKFVHEPFPHVEWDTGSADDTGIKSGKGSGLLSRLLGL